MLGRHTLRNMIDKGVLAYGTSDGATKGWDSRGRGRAIGYTSKHAGNMQWLHDHTKANDPDLSTVPSDAKGIREVHEHLSNGDIAKAKDALSRMDTAPREAVYDTLGKRLSSKL